jgi:hypothetical protein
VIEAPTETRETTDKRASGDRFALAVFASVVAAALPLYLVRGREQWFFLDEWDFLADRRATSIHDLFHPHNEHWSTLPILVYRTLWHVVGINHYWPYQLILIILHLTAAVLLWFVIRRAGVHPWLATVVASVFALLGSGRQDIVWAFQIGFTGSLVCGLAALLLTDHDGPWSTRDWFGIALGLAGLMSSGVGVTMTVVVSLAILLRRGWRMAARYAVPLAAVFAAWWVAFARGAYGSAGASTDAFEFVGIGIGHAFHAIGHIPLAGFLLAVVLVAGLGVAWRREPNGALLGRAAGPIALLVGAVLFFVISGFGRAASLGTGFARGGRYVHLFAAMMLPALAVAVDALVRRWRLLAPALVVLLLLGIPGNIAAIRPTGIQRITLGDPTLFRAMPRSPYAREVPRSLRPILGAHEVTVGWLLDGVASGRIPAPPHMSPEEQAAVALQLAVSQRSGGVASRNCTPLTAPVERRLRAGDRFGFTGGPIVLQLTTPDGVTSAPVGYSRQYGQTLQAVVGPIDVRISPSPFRNDRAALCG